MPDNAFYYVHRDDDGTPTRIAKQVGHDFFGWENGDWISMPSLSKIMYDVTADYDEISKDEADKLIAQ